MEHISFTLLVVIVNVMHIVQLLISIGTTGKPKGVDVTHMGLTNALCLRPSNLNIKVGCRVAQLLSISFDMGELPLGPLTDDY
jgi:non-ribosomal peptide synthetase component F